MQSTVKGYAYQLSLLLVSRAKLAYCGVCSALYPTSHLVVHFKGSHPEVTPFAAATPFDTYYAKRVWAAGVYQNR